MAGSSNLNERVKSIMDFNAGKSAAGGVKDDPVNCVPLFLLDLPVGQVYCCGLISNGGERFCTRLVLESGRCSKVSYGKKVQILPRYFYV